MATPATSTTTSNPNLDLLLSGISRLSGWIYTAAWSLSFYPQPLSNYRRRSTSGLTPDFPLLNVFGFSSYTLSTALFLFSATIRNQYAARHPHSPEPTVRGNDFVFGLHACVLVAVTYSQFWPGLWGWGKEGEVGGVGSGGVERGNKKGVDVEGVGRGRKGRRATRVSVGIVWGCVLGIAITTCLVLFGAGGGMGLWQWIDVVYAISYVKLLLTVFKYIPQVIANHRRKSTRGWSIWQVLLDLLGGLLSLVQLVIDSARQGDWSGLTGNPVKLGLANISILFDVVFMVQHYVLYGESKEEAEDPEGGREDSGTRRDEREPLLRTNGSVGR